MCIPGYLTVSQLEQSILFLCHEHKLMCGMRICTNVGFCKVSPECWLCRDFRILLLLSDIVIKWSELISSNSVKMQLELEIFLIITICQSFSWPSIARVKKIDTWLYITGYKDADCCLKVTCSRKERSSKWFWRLCDIYYCMQFAIL